MHTDCILFFSTLALPRSDFTVGGMRPPSQPDFIKLPFLFGIMNNVHHIYKADNIPPAIVPEYITGSDRVSLFIGM